MNYTRLDLLAAGVFQALALVFVFRRNSCSMPAAVVEGSGLKF